MLCFVTLNISTERVYIVVCSTSGSNYTQHCYSQLSSEDHYIQNGIHIWDMLEKYFLAYMKRSAFSLFFNLKTY